MAQWEGGTLDGGARRVPLLNESALEAQAWPANALRNPDKVARLLRLFSSPRKRFGLTPDEVLIFLAIGHLCTRASNGVIEITAVSLVNVSALLGIPRETIRRKIARLAERHYVSCSSKGVLIKEVKLWCEMLERVLA